MAITFPITGVVDQVLGSRSPSFTLGTSPVEDDILVVFVSSTTTAASTDVAGWTNTLGADTVVMPSDSACAAVMVYHRVSADEDTANTVTWTLTNLWDVGETGNITVCVLRGAATSGVLVGTASGSDSIDAATPWVIPTVTPTGDNCVIVAGIAGNGSATQTTPTGWTNRASTSTYSNYLYTRDALGVSGTPTGTTDVTPSAGNEYVSIVACFAPYIITGTIGVTEAADDGTAVGITAVVGTIAVTNTPDRTPVATGKIVLTVAPAATVVLTATPAATISVDTAPAAELALTVWPT